MACATMPGPALSLKGCPGHSEHMVNGALAVVLAEADCLLCHVLWYIHPDILLQVARGTLSDSALDAVETGKDLLGASGLMLLLPPKVKSEDVAEEDLYWLSALLQLKQLLQAKPFQPALPLAVLMPSSRGDSAGRAVEDGV